MKDTNNCEVCWKNPYEYECNGCKKYFCEDCKSIDGIFENHYYLYCKDCRKKLHKLLIENKFETLITEL